MPDKKSQIEKFREAARALKSVGDDEYDAAVTKVAKAQKLSNEQIKELARLKRESEPASKRKP
ncbi:hypothetical protein [Mesorhizobium sp. WSM3876]|uniref:hypothetical protein n=1 Tax=Mesorhizobium sp. WSM3876 TaxID=422277 RepID=UPI001140C931|nr:hypothetical protein [Mesorhizobium sp. WSM3876]